MIQTVATTEPDWDLTTFFPGPDSAQLLSFLEALESELQEQLAGGVQADTDTILTIEDLGARSRHLGAYLGCLVAARTTDEAAHRARARLSKLSAELDKVVTGLEVALAELDDAAFEELAGNPALEPVRYALTRGRAQAHTRMGLQLEELRAEIEVTGLHAWGRMRERVVGRLTFEHESGEQGRLPISRARSLLEDPDRGVRHSAARGVGRAWESVSDALGAALNAISGERLVLDAKRGIEHYLDPALFDAAIERHTLDAMLGAVRERQGIVRRWLAKKAQLLGIDDFSTWDLSAPLPHDDAAPPSSLSWQQGADRVRAAFARYPALAQLAERAFTNDWIDHSPRSAKAQGGFCSTSPLADGSRIFMTFDGKDGDVRTLAHELGHAFHGWLMRDQRPWARRYPMTLAESASTFGETLVVEASLAAAGSGPDGTAKRRAILARRLDDAALYLTGTVMRFDFECALYERRAQAELSVDELCELALEAQRKNYGSALAESGLNPWTWASTLHFYLTGIRFYNFPYTFGYLFSTALATRARAEGEAFFATYEALLRDTGSRSAEDLAAHYLGVDLGDPTFWHAAIDEVERDLDQFLSL